MPPEDRKQTTNIRQAVTCTLVRFFLPGTTPPTFVFYLRTSHSFGQPFGGRDLSPTPKRATKPGDAGGVISPVARRPIKRQKPGLWRDDGRGKGEGRRGKGEGREWRIGKRRQKEVGRINKGDGTTQRGVEKGKKGRGKK